MSDKPVKRRSLGGFYVATGVVVLLLVGFCFAWAPLKIWYWEREVSPYDGSGRSSLAAVKLVEIGPAAQDALKRLLSSGDHLVISAVLGAIKQACARDQGRNKVDWVVPLVVPLTQGKDEADIDAAVQILRRFAGDDFCRDMKSSAEIQAGVRDWWEKEGKAKYGGIGK